VQSVNEEGYFVSLTYRLKKLQPLLLSQRTLPEILKQYMNGKIIRLDVKNGEDKEAAGIQFTNSNK
jgi:hypothetical protein